MLGDRRTALADLHLPLRIGGDMAVLKGMMKVVFELEAEHPGKVIDRAFIERDTTGFDAFRRTLDNSTWEEIEAQSGLRQSLIREAGQMFRPRERRYHLLGDGVDAAQTRGRDDSGNRQPASFARSDRQARHGSVSCARSFKCSG
jgi:anaerobic selenocysteine-containing dehydrogenase